MGMTGSAPQTVASMRTGIGVGDEVGKGVEVGAAWFRVGAAGREAVNGAVGETGSGVFVGWQAKRIKVMTNKLNFEDNFRTDTSEKGIIKFYFRVRVFDEEK